MSEEKRKVRTNEELVEIAIGIAEGKIFCSAQIHPDDQASLLQSVFLPFAFMTLEHRQSLIDNKIAVFYEYLSEAGPRSVNGYPSFFSLKTLNETEWKFVTSKIKECDEMKDNLRDSAKTANQETIS